MIGNVAIVGIGAIARAFYLPALRRQRTDFADLWLVDINEASVEAGLALVDARRATTLSQVEGELALVIVAVPNAHHLRLATEALQRNANVLVEKPFVVLPADGDQLIALSETQGKLVAVNQTRRYYPALDVLRSIVANNSLGRLTSIDHVEGVKLDWPFESGAAFTPGAFRTGVIMDFAVHVLDYYHALLRPEWSFLTAVHDGFAGPEGLADIHLKAGEIPLHLHLSRYQFLRNTARLQFERGLVEFDVFDWNGVTITPAGGKPKRISGTNPVSDYTAIAERLLTDVFAAIETGSAPRCAAADSLPVIQLLDRIYTGATRYPEAVGAV
jgi:predicted dehydrogenase